MKRVIKASYNGDSGKYFLELPESERHNGKKRWRLQNRYGEELVVSWRQNHYDAWRTRQTYHPKGYESGFTHETFRLTDNDLRNYTVLAEMH